MKKVLAMILAGGEGERLSILSEKRAKPAVPFAGKYRIIDFALSNCVNSNIFDVAVLTQYRPRSLHDHIGIGIPWDLNRANGGIALLQPYLGRADEDWYKGTADAVYQNLSYIRDNPSEHILILAGDHIYKMDYSWMLDFHERKQADVTVAVLKVPIEEASKFGVLATDATDAIVEFEEKPIQPKSNLVSMGIYLFRRDVLRDVLIEGASRPSGHDFGKNVIPAMLGRYRVFAYRFDGFWRDVGTIQSYWESHMVLLEDLPPLNLYDSGWRIHTTSEERAAAKVGEYSRVSRSMVCHGCIVNGAVEHSVLSPGVRVEEGAYVKDSIVMLDCVIGRDAVLDRVILDKEVVVAPGCHIGHGDDYTYNKEEPARLNTGVTIVGKRTHFPPGLHVGRNVKIGTDLRESDFPASRWVASGDTIELSKTELVNAW